MLHSHRRKTANDCDGISLRVRCDWPNRGLLGLGIGSLLVRIGNQLTAARGVEIFYISPRLVLLTLVFSLLLGVLAGVYPAYRASRLDCVEALRRE